MLSAFRTYRLLPALVAALFFAGVGLPLVGYACGVTAGPGAAAPVVAEAQTSSASPCGDFADCQGASTRASMEAPVETPATTAPEAIDPGASCCTIEASKQAFAIVAPSTSWTNILLLPSVFLEVKALPRISFYSSSLSGRESDATSSAPVPVRLVTSVFLL